MKLIYTKHSLTSTVLFTSTPDDSLGNVTSKYRISTLAYKYTIFICMFDMKVSVVVLTLLAVIAFAVMVIMVCATVAVVVSCSCHRNQTVINGKLNNFKCACINNIILF